MPEIPRAPHNCDRCERMCGVRSKVVYGVGSEGARIAFVGQNPYEMEDQEGKPFLGQAGRVLRTICDIAGIRPRDTYRTNANLCWTPGNSRPTSTEIENCHDFLIEELKAVNPSCIVALGDAAFESLYLLPKKRELRGDWEETALFDWQLEVGYLNTEFDRAVAEWEQQCEVWRQGHDRGVKKPLKPRRPALPPRPKPPTGEKVSLTSIAGQTLLQPELGIPMVATFHPAWLLRDNWGSADMVISHFEKARRIAYGEQEAGELGDYRTITSIKKLNALRDYLLSDLTGDVIYFDTETTGTNFMTAELLCISLSTQAGEGFVVPILQQGGVPCEFWEGKYPKVIATLKEIFASPKRKVAQNTPFDVAMLEREAEWPFVDAITAFGIKIAGVWQDTEQIHQLVAESIPHNMDNVLSLYTSTPYYSGEVSQQSKGKKRMQDVDNEVLWKYSAADADGLARIENALMPIVQQEGTGYVLDNVSNPLLRLCWDMQRRGTLIDQDYFDRLCLFYDDRIAEEEEKLFALLENYDWTRPITAKQKQEGKLSNGKRNYLHAPRMQDILFDWFGLPASGRATKGAKNCEECTREEPCELHDQTGIAALQEVMAKKPHPILPIYISLKKLTKVKSSYLDGGAGGWKRYIRADGRLHSTVQVSRVETGRLAYKDPNQQQAPKEIHIHPIGSRCDDEGCQHFYANTYGIDTTNAFRDIIVAPEGKGIMNVDWQMLEVWVLAYVLDEQFHDPTLLNVLESGRDVHLWAARIIWSDLDPELDDGAWRKLHGDKRNKAKIFVFGNNYGLTIQGTMDRLGCTEEEATEWTKRYMANIPGLPRYVQWVKRMLIERGYVPNVFGRRRHSRGVTLLRAMNRHNDVEGLVREFQNMPVQSGGSDIHSPISVLTNEYEPLLKRGCFPIFSVHDSLTFEFDYPDEEYAKQTAWIIKSLWEETAPQLLRPDGTPLGWKLYCEVEWGSRWGSPTSKIDAKGVYSSEELK